MAKNDTKAYELYFSTLKLLITKITHSTYVIVQSQAVLLLTLGVNR